MTGTTGAAASTATQPKTAQRLVGLDGLRGVLALSVILVHTTGALAPLVLRSTHIDLIGQVIVVFFVMSGFLIFWPFASKIIENRSIVNLGRYFLNRAFRVYPAYVVIFLIANFGMGAVFVANAVESMEPYSDTGSGRITDPLQLLAHLTLVQNYFPWGLQTGINSSWTLTVELTFYALLPLLAIATSWIGRSWRYSRYVLAALPGVALIALGILSRAFSAIWFESTPGMDLLDAEWGATWHAVFARSFPVWADNFGVGMLIVVGFLAVRKGDLSRVGPVPLRTAASILLVVSLLAAAVCLFVLPRFVSTAVAVASGAMLILLLVPPRPGMVPRLARLFDWKVFHYIGLVSLSTYLWHYPVLLVVIRLGLAGPDTLLGATINFVTVSVISIALASVTYWLVERPAQKWRFGRTS